MNCLHLLFEAQYAGYIPGKLWSGISDVQLLVSEDGRRWGMSNFREYVR